MIKKNKIQRLLAVKSYKKYMELLEFKTKANLNSNKFLNQYLYSLGLFFNKTKNIQLVCKQLEKNYETEEILKTFLKNTMQTRRFSKESYFHEGRRILFIATYQKKSSKLIIDFISQQIKKIHKKRNQFFHFLKKTLPQMVKLRHSKILGIKIQISGRTNNSPRSKVLIISSGNLTIQTLKSSIDYAKTSISTKNGTIGVKVWVNEKIKIKKINVFTAKKI